MKTKYVVGKRYAKGHGDSLVVVIVDRIEGTNYFVRFVLDEVNRPAQADEPYKMTQEMMDRQEWRDENAPYTPEPSRAICIELPEYMVKEIESWLRFTGELKDDFSSHGALTLEQLTVMLLEDVYWTTERPGSWEGDNMLSVLRSHGYVPSEIKLQHKLLRRSKKS